MASAAQLSFLHTIKAAHASGVLHCVLPPLVEGKHTPLKARRPTCGGDDGAQRRGLQLGGGVREELRVGDGDQPVQQLRRIAVDHPQDARHAGVKVALHHHMRDQTWDACCCRSGLVWHDDDGLRSLALLSHWNLVGGAHPNRLVMATSVTYAPGHASHEGERTPSSCACKQPPHKLHHLEWQVRLASAGVDTHLHVVLHQLGHVDVLSFVQVDARVRQHRLLRREGPPGGGVVDGLNE